MNDRMLARYGDRLAFASLMSGAYASAAVALFFLAVDGARGAPLFTPSLVGTALFAGAWPVANEAIRFDMVALYSVFHLVACVAWGTALSVVYATVPAFQRRPWALAAASFATVTLAVAVVDAVALPGLVGSLGAAAVLAANAVASMVATVFIHTTLAEEALAPGLVPVRADRGTPAARRRG